MSRIDAGNRKENNRESNEILQANRGYLSNQCEVILSAMQRGERLTTSSALTEYGIGDLRRRVCDLKQHGYKVSSVRMENRYKQYFIESN